VATAFLEQTEADGAASAEFRIHRQDGQLRWLSVRSFPVDDVGGEPMRAVICEDITERKRIEQALRESELRFRQVAENIEEIFWIMAPDGTQVHYVSPAYEKILGRPKEELAASPFKWMQAIHVEDQPRVLDAVTHHQAEHPLEIQFQSCATAPICAICHRSALVRDAAGRWSRWCV
jgi:PAS domain-containing protein